ncbi:MAG: 16S rRNA (adenine(1518)-N(6)/adenine(1519)-N(6))-dimethyltransferase RsmA [Bacillota bacterium]
MEKSIATPKMTKKILKEHNIRLNKRLGQNFLIDPNIIDIIIESAKIKGNEIIVEIGPGIGSLTEYLLKSANNGKVIAIEKDSRFIKILKDQFKDEIKNKKLQLVNDDVLNIKWDKFLKEYNKKVKILANLPYYITTPVIMGLLESDYKFDTLIFMIQKEVAERMVSGPGTKKYGSLSVAVQYHTNAEIIHQVPSSVFMPSPEVQSAIIKLEQYKDNPYKPLDEEFFFSIVKAIFQQRRKNIKNGLTKAAEINLPKEVVLKSLEEVQIDRRKRGEKLTIEKMVELSNSLKKKLKNY